MRSLLLSLLLIAASATPSTNLTCDDIQQRCIERLPCGMAFHGHRLDCKLELSGRTPGQCSVACRQSLVSLASTEEGFELVRCDCGTDTFCKTLRQRTTTCWWQKPPCRVHEGSKRPSCSRIAKNCVVDPVCATAWEYYRRFCHEVLGGGGRTCSARCRNSVSILVRMEEAHRLLDCVCDAEVSWNVCVRELNTVRTLCFGLGPIEPSKGAVTEVVGLPWVVGAALWMVAVSW